MWSKIPGDHFLMGMLMGMITLCVTYFSLRSIRLSLAEYYGNPFIFPSPRIEFISILINILFFRVVIVNLKKEKTGRGILFITGLLSILFFFLFFKFNYRLP